ncbi:hypothetical protein TRFO_13776 [Tritrichomonas foetus]|uniref:ATP-grasp domain-containing protein n=1 Tax=Tritrichomonas foetus TaxID=1144522 RepID=A0A1J4KWW8_9EUKA|nr:hypothetical protein TRFO_13776 [Tritrichomonas foetus]|eukprot:OHT15785.1 hypothetical protein TRFO_13776 [Tritrichomonas foetus]
MENPPIITASDGKVLYNVVRDTFQQLNIPLSPDNRHSILVWYDNVKEQDYFSLCPPWQVINRLPMVNVICRKAPFVRLLQRMQLFFPLLYNFLPKSFILPLSNTEFIQIVAKHDKTYIIKPDNGSLGAGIKILSPKMSFAPSSVLSIAQEYIESFLIDDTKFDLRIYALVLSLSPLKILVYRNGVARFCSKKTHQKEEEIKNKNPQQNNKNMNKTQTMNNQKSKNKNLKDLHSKSNNNFKNTTINQQSDTQSENKTDTQSDNKADHTTDKQSSKCVSSSENIEQSENNNNNTNVDSKDKAQTNETKNVRLNENKPKITKTTASTSTNNLKKGIKSKNNFISENDNQSNSNGTNDIFAMITNTSVNRNNPNITEIASITKTVDEVFNTMKKDYKVDIDELWKKIDNTIILTILSCYGFLLQGEEKQCQNCGYSRCFQILGFDVLIDKNLDPYILEVNYRPSLETDTEEERQLKLEMLTDTLKIAAFPLAEIQNIVNQQSNPESFNIDSWKTFLNQNHSSCLKQIEELREKEINNGKNKYVQIFPSNDPELSEVYEKVMNKAKQLPTSLEDRFKLPYEIKDKSLYDDHEPHMPPITKKKAGYSSSNPRSTNSVNLQSEKLKSQSNTELTYQTGNQINDSVLNSQSINASSTIKSTSQLQPISNKVNNDPEHDENSTNQIGIKEPSAPHPVGSAPHRISNLRASESNVKGLITLNQNSRHKTLQSKIVSTSVDESIHKVDSIQPKSLLGSKRIRRNVMKPLVQTKNIFQNH